MPNISSPLTSSSASHLQMDTAGQMDEEDESSVLADLASNTSLFASDNFPFLNGFPSSLTSDFLQQLQANMAAASSSTTGTSASSVLANPPTQILARNSTKTLKCPKCNWHYKYQETLEIHMKEKHAEGEVNCVYCAQNQAHPKLARGESYSCGYKPYRCDLCKYSTTTKGNLSIHMQSDKHLHAMQEMPLNNIASPSHTSLLQSEGTSSAGLEAEDRTLLQCLICGNFATGELAAMLEHLELDRSRTCAGDIQATHGFFQCNLCPYNTNLKANFQLHTRTDKHLQRVQLINHMREGIALSAGRSATALCRLASIKSMVQVRCRACQDVFSCAFSLREHCESSAHLAQLNFVQQHQTDRSATSKKPEVPSDTLLTYKHLLWLQLICQQPIDPLLNLVYQCLCCPFHTSQMDSAAAHLRQHLESDQSVLNSNLKEDIDAAPEVDFKPAFFHNRPVQLIFSWDDLNSYFLEMEEARLLCNKCPDFCAESQELLDEHQSTQHDQQPSGSQQAIKLEVNEESVQPPTYKCPLCSHKLADKAAVRHHLSQEHKIVEEEAVEKLTSAVESSGRSCSVTKVESSGRLSPSSAIFRHRCTDCSMAFKTNERLQQHQLSHSNPQIDQFLRLDQQCPFSATPAASQSSCQKIFDNAAALYQHVFECHRPEESSESKGCELCGHTFDNPDSLLVHLKSPAHLNRTKKLLEEKQQFSTASSNLSAYGDAAANGGGTQELKQFNDQVFSLLLRQNPSLLSPAPQFGNCLRSSSKRNGSQKSSSSVSSSSQMFYNQKPCFASNAKPFRCNVCLQAYSQGQTLDTHLRSLSHQNRMNRLQELVGNGQVDVLRPVSEQPGGIPQKTIAELLGLPFTSDKMEISPMLNSLFFGSAVEVNDLDDNTTNGGVDLSLKKRKANPSLTNFMKPLSTEQQPHKHSTVNTNNSFFNNFCSMNKSSKYGQPNALLASQMMAITQLLQQQQSDTTNSSNWLTAMMAGQQQTAVPTSTPMFDFSTLLNTQLGLAGANQEDQEEDSPSTSPSPTSQAPRIKVTPAKSRHHNKKVEGDEEEKANSAPPIDKPFSLSDLLSKRESKEEPEEEEKSPKVKRLRSDSTPSANNSLKPFGEMPKTPVKGPKKVENASSPINDVGNQLAMMMSASSSFPNFLAAAMAAQGGGGIGGGTDLLASSMSLGEGDSPQKRARTRITDEQLKVLRQYFDINNSPSEEHIKEMSIKAGLPEKVIKHWFRNTLFKERQRDKDSPYNFNVPPQMSIDLATYEKTGETKITPLKQNEEVDLDQAVSNDSSPSAQASTTSPLQPTIAAKCSPPYSPQPNTPANETVNEENEEEDEEEENHIISTSPNNETNSFATDFLVNLNKAAAVAAANNLMGNYAAVAANMAQQQQQLPSGFASFFGSATPALQQEPEEKTLSSMLGLSSFPSFSPSSVTSSSNNATPSLVGQQPQSSLIHSNSQNSPALVGTGRRANRTRFTDFQLRTLQNFFDKQAYPKDDDLEMLSKKMGLSPRVIVVWFQNARQKARKIYENQPNHPDNNERFVRTPGSNFQCKRCQLVFQRYYELIQHQQKVCYMGDGDAQQTDNKSLEENLSEDEKGVNSGISQATILNGLGLQDNNSSEHQAVLMAGSLMNSILTPETLEKFNISLNNNNNNTPELAAQEGQQSNAQQDLFKLITSSGKSSAEAMLKMFKSKERKHQFYKRCPFCGVLFQSKEKLVEHLPKKHPEQMQAANVDVDALPDADDVPSFSDEFLSRLHNGNAGDEAVGRGVSPLDLSFPANEEQEQSVSPTSQSEENDDENRVDTYDDYSGISAFDQLSRNSPIGSSRSSVTPSSSFSTTLNIATANHQGSMAAAAAAAANSKRYRTHLTPLQVYIMKSLFNDYKTPSMSECDLLGREIGLHKRVVQVWYQNARAKERKSKGEEDLQTNTRVSLPRCELCCVEFSLMTTSMQDHIFTPAHIEKIKERGASLKGMATTGIAAPLEQLVDQQEGRSCRTHTHSSSSSRQKAVRDNQKRHSSNNHQTMEALAAQFPYNLMGGYGLPHAAAALPSMIYDPNLIGTPISMLQIPELVMQQISSDLAKGRQESRFTQDGLKLGQLNGKVSDGDYLCASTMESEVGWACPQCSNVFQQESFLRNHQKLICQGCDGVFRLIQIHYECLPCHTKFGTQDEFRLHCDASSHKSVATMFSASSSSSAKAIRSSSTTSC